MGRQANIKICDGIGGTVKRLVARASLQATVNNQILTAEEMYKWAVENIKAVKFFFLTSNDIKENTNKYDLEQRYSAAKTITGTRSHHSFIPVSNVKMEMRRVSTDNIFTTVITGPITEEDNEDADLQNIEKFQPGGYVACIYDNQWYIGHIIEKNIVENDVFVNFMQQGRGNTFVWPPENRVDKCWVPAQHILCSIEAPSMKHHGGRQYKISEHNFKQIKDLFSSFK